MQSAPIIYRLDEWQHQETGNIVRNWSDAHVDLEKGEITEEQHQAISEIQSYKIVEDSFGLASWLSRWLLVKLSIVRLPRIIVGDSIFIPKEDATQEDSTYYKDHIPSGVKKAYACSPLHGISRLPNSHNVEFRTDMSAKGSISLLSWMRSELSTYNDKPLNGYYENLDMTSSPGRFSRHFIDARIAHHLYNNADKPIIDIFAGGWHCDNLNQLMPSLGYIHKKSVGQSIIEQPTTMNINGKKIKGTMTVVRPINIKKELEALSSNSHPAVPSKPE
jgi:hypothetical protein